MHSNFILNRIPLICIICMEFMEYDILLYEWECECRVLKQEDIYKVLFPYGICKN